ncbi:Aste57867_8622 [Aphanomyces stellatus]|uniref:Aste57867_8622 protein n=1 Tax=Aphanomyces stellatus TaxID=120398 RepID=A0A485KKR3_9STRA|nr:hypothetical protein As57867_008588 [Aphanomyces stellatus]VFT85508.1 Aste57867_8622 [Aphanomyces stellatus]
MPPRSETSINTTRKELGRLGLERTSLRLDAKAFPTSPAYPSVVKAVTAKVQPQDLKSLMTWFVIKFTTRHKTSAEVEHGWGQFSIILKLDPVATPKKQDLLILGTHQDSINQRGDKAAPWADDDASGVVTNLVALRSLLATHASNRMSFLLGQRKGSPRVLADCVAKCQGEGRCLRDAAMLHVRTGWDGGGTKVISFTDDYTTLPLTLLFDRNTCGYGCSDHAPWFQAGYPTVYPFEEDGDVNPNIHSTKDTIETLDLNRVAEFTRLSVAFMVELSQGGRINTPAGDAMSEPSSIDDDPTTN